MAGGDILSVHDPRLHYAHNDRSLRERTVTAAEDVPDGKVTLRSEFESTVRPASLPDGARRTGAGSPSSAG